MATMTLLEMVQTILSSMDSDEVNSITDTVESEQVARVIKTAYFDIISKIDFPEHFNVFELEASGDVTKPVLMTKPTDVQSIIWIRYDNQTEDDDTVNYQLVNYKTQEEFFRDMYTLNPDNDNVETFNHVVGTSTIPIYYTNDASPKWYTVLGEYYILFDSFDEDVESTLQKNKTSCYGRKDVSWSQTDSFVPELDSQHFPLLLQEAKALAHYELKQVQHQKAEVSARQQKIALQRNKTGIPAYISGIDHLPNYGRRV